LSQPVAMELDGEKLTRVIRLAIGKDCSPIDQGGRVRAYKLLELFPDEETARICFEKHFWPNGPICPRCQSGVHVRSRRNGLFCCNACERGFTVRVGTIFANSHIPLRKWLCAIFLFSSARVRISSIKLAEQLGIRQESAWAMIHRICKVWDQWRNVFKKLLEQIGACLDSTHSWPFFTSKKRSQPTKIVEVPEDDPYHLAPDELLVTAETLEAGKLVSSWTAFFKKRPLTKLARLALGRRRERFRIHTEDHIQWMSRHSTMRDCPVCKFGVHEWRFWEDPIKFLAYDVWEEFWDWISEREELLTPSHREILNQFPVLSDDVLYQFEDSKFINWFVRLGCEGMVQYLRHHQSREVQRRQRREQERLAEQLARSIAMESLDSTQDVLI
jgi:transposase-like protein